MSDSIVYEHNSIIYGANTSSGFYKLVKYKDQTISVFVSYDPHCSGNIIVLKNLDSKKEVHLIVELYTNFTDEYIFTRYLDVFMYSESILYIGLLCQKGYGVWFFNLKANVTEKVFVINEIREIKPVGQKYFIVESKHNIDCKLYQWEHLFYLDKLFVPINPINPVYQFKNSSDLFAVDWSSSSIGHLASCSFLQTDSNSNQIDFLDKHFNLIVSLNVEDLFPNYQPVKFIKHSAYIPKEKMVKKIVTVGANCLLFFEYRKKIGQLAIDFEPELANIDQSGQTNIYCWDFTSNAPVIFPNYQLDRHIYWVRPFRNLSGKVKYISEEMEKPSDFSNVKCKVYESFG